MEENNFTQIEKDLQQIADMMLLNGTLTECPGLMHGKMGIIVLSGAGEHAESRFSGSGNPLV